MSYTVSTKHICNLYTIAYAWRSEDPQGGTDLSGLRDSNAAEFERWLAAHDAEVAATEQARIATVIAEDAETWEATADRLRLEKEYADSNRYYNYAAARRNVAAMLRNGAYGPGTLEPRAAEYRKTETEGK